jgi:hypothetical protein
VSVFVCVRGMMCVCNEIGVAAFRRSLLDKLCIYGTVLLGLIFKKWDLVGA